MSPSSSINISPLSNVISLLPSNVNLLTSPLEPLPGIGPANAKSIIDYREENGDFISIDNLIEVPGIGEATMNEIREYITT